MEGHAMVTAAGACVVSRRDAKRASRRVLEEVWNEDDHGRLGELIGRECLFDDVTMRSGRPTSLALIDLVNAYKAFVPDLRFEVVTQVKERRTVMTYWRAEGRHSGLALKVPPTRQPVQLRGTLVATTTPAGAVERVRGTWDLRGFAQQVGVGAEDIERMLWLADDAIPLRAVHESPEGVPVLFFPAMSLPGWITWRRFTDALRDRRPVVNYQCLANRWAIERPEVTHDYSLKGEISSLRAALEQSGCRGPYDVVGHSAGGTLALDFALDHGDDVRSLTLIEPGLAWLLSATGALDPDLRRVIRRRISCYTGRLTASKYAAFLRETYGDPAYEPTTSPRWPLLCAYMRNMRFRRTLFTSGGEPERLRSLRCPVLLIQGRDSDALHRAGVAALRTWITGATYVEMPGGHVPHFGAGVVPFLTILEQFHGSVDQSTSRSVP